MNKKKKKSTCNFAEGFNTENIDLNQCKDIQVINSQKLLNSRKKKQESLKSASKNSANGLGYNKLTAELVGILLGDGSIRPYSFGVDLNRIDEAEYVDYVKELIYKVFNKYPREELREDKEGRKFGKGIRLKINGVKIIQSLIELGLKIGNKIENQIGVPEWILNNRDLNLSCLRGLFDTDGNIDIHKKWKSITLRYVSASKPLINHFKQMCESLEIKTSNIRNLKIKSYEDPQKIYNAWVVSIGSKSNVKKFIEIVNPQKWFFRRNIIAMILIILRDLLKFKIVTKKRELFFPNEKKINQFSKDYLNFLQNLFSEHGWPIDESVIDKVIEDTLKLKRHGYNIPIAEELKNLFEKNGTINDIIEHFTQQGEFPLDFHTVKNHLKRLFTEHKYLKLFRESKFNPLEVPGDSFYEKWNNNNIRILIDQTKKEVVQFNSKLRIKLAFEMFKILSSIESSQLPTDEEVLLELKDLIDNSPYLGRMSYLLNNPLQKQIIISYLKKLITIIKEIINSPNITIYEIYKKTNLRKDTIREIIKNIKKNNN